MNAGKKSARRAVQSRNVLSRDNTCSSCLHRLNISTTSRRHASAAAAAAEQSASPENEVVASSTPPATATGPRKVFRLLCSPVVSRPPLLTRELTSFEKAFFLYQKRLNERLALPFTRYFYYKKDTPADTQWKRQAKARKGTASRDVGVYNAYDEEGWNDEVLVGSQLSEPSDVVEKLIRDAEGKDIVDAEPQGDAEAGAEAVSGNAMAGEGTRKPVSEITVERPQPRTTKDDAENNKQSLNRKLDRTLYMVVKNKDGAWRFPQDRVLGRESLHQAAERILLQAGGINMNTWVVGNHPIGHYAAKFAKPILSKILGNRLVSTSKAELEQEEYGERVFFMKTRIFAGQADLKLNELGDTEFQWLCKEEVKDRVHPQYWSQIQHMLAER